MIAIRRRLRLLLAVVAAVVALAMIATALRMPLYTATAEVVVDVGGTAGTAADDRLATEIAILRSRGMARRVADTLRLDADPAFAAPTGAWPRLKRALGLRAADAAPGDPRRTADRLIAGLSVSRPDQTYALAIGFSDADAQTAARIANEYARFYVGDRGAVPMAAALADRPDARIISAAEPPLAPAAPRPLLVFAVALLAGIALGAIAAIVAERRFAGLTGSAEIEAKLGLYHLGSIPTLASVLPDATVPLDAVVDAPMSGFAESFRSVFMATRQVGGKGTQVIALTSALPNEGKSTIAACLARTIALGGESVVLVDCDARRRDASAMFRAENGRPGLAEVLRLEKTLDEALVRDTASGAWILPLTGPAAEISDLLTGAAMESLVVELARRFKRVVIDTAPLLPISATRAIAAMADITLIVVRWRTTADHAVQAALKMLPGNDVRIGGVVLSQVDMRRQVKYGRGDQTFYYQQYSKYYS